MDEGTTPAPPRRLHVTLQQAAAAGWQAEVAGAGPPRRFDSLLKLIAWLATLDLPPSPPPPPRSGIR